MDQGSPATKVSEPLSSSARSGPPTAAVTALYEQHALSLIRLAHIMLGDRAAAEDVVQDAFWGLYRRWDQVANKDRALSYVRSSVLNGCRTILRKTVASELTSAHSPVTVSAEAAVLSAEERREVVRALRRLPGRQRDVLVLRYYLDLPDDQIAGDLGVSASSVRSIRRRALAALERLLKEGS
jgi:RNA polymerase sigma-70 factor (sigma-E family)